MRFECSLGSGDGLDLLAMTAAFKAVVIEGVEVVLDSGQLSGIRRRCSFQPLWERPQPQS